MRSFVDRLRRRLLHLLAAIGLAVSVVTLTPLVPWWARALAGPWNDPKGDIVVVLGSESNDGVIGASTYLRTMYAVRVWREGWVKKILVSGDEPLAGQMREFLVGSGVPAWAVLVEGRSTSTRENALFSKEILASLGSSQVLLTSDYHCYRAWRVFQRAGIAVEPRPIPDVLKRANHWINRPALALDLAGETAKILYYQWKGWI